MDEGCKFDMVGLGCWKADNGWSFTLGLGGANSPIISCYVMLHKALDLDVLDSFGSG